MVVEGAFLAQYISEKVVSANRFILKPLLTLGFQSKNGVLVHQGLVYTQLELQHSIINSLKEFSSVE